MSDSIIYSSDKAHGRERVAAFLRSKIKRPQTLDLIQSSDWNQLTGLIYDIWQLLKKLDLNRPERPLFYSIVDPYMSIDSELRSRVHFPIFYHLGRYWCFYYDGYFTVYRTSTDGIEWSFPTFVIFLKRAFTWFDGEYVHFTYGETGYNKPIYYMRGKPQSDGTMTLDEEQIAVPAGGGYTTQIPHGICTDAYGYPFIIYPFRVGTMRHLRVTKSARNDGVWETATEFPYTIVSSSSDQLGKIMPLEGDMVLAFYHGLTPAYLYARRWNGASWDSAKQVSSMMLHESWQFAFISDPSAQKACLAYVRAIPVDGGGYLARQVGFRNYDYINDSWETETVIWDTMETGEVFYDITPTLLEDGSLVIFAVLYGDYRPLYYGNCIKSIMCVEGAWSQPIEVFFGKKWRSILELVSFHKQTQGRTAIAFTKGETAPYSLVFSCYVP